MIDELTALRDQINALDFKIHDLLNGRAQIALKIGRVKRSAGGNDTTLYHPEREAEVLKRISDHNKGPLSSEAVSSIFKAIMKECLAIQGERS